MLKSLYGYGVLLLILVAMCWAGSSDFEVARRSHVISYIVAR